LPAGGANAALFRERLLATDHSAPPERSRSVGFTLKPGVEPAILGDPRAMRADAAAYERATKKGDIDKVGGAPVCGNPLRPTTCVVCRLKLRFLAQLLNSAGPQPFGDGTIYLHTCPRWHRAAVQVVR
jgi:hypothetical protein